jgi:hypothetical protein
MKSIPIIYEVETSSLVQRRSTIDSAATINRDRVRACIADRNLESINPNSKNFDFNLWATAVRSQMLTVFQKNLVADNIVDEEE